MLSGTVALIPYLLFKLSVLGLYSFLVWLPLYVYEMVKSVALSVIGTLIGIYTIP